MLLPEQDLHEHRRAAEEPDVEPARRRRRAGSATAASPPARRRARSRSPSRSRSARSSRRRPCRMRLENRYSPTIAHSKRGLSAADSSQATRPRRRRSPRPPSGPDDGPGRPGCPRAAPSASRSSRWSELTAGRALADRAVDLRVVDRARLDAPLFEDRRVLAVGDQLLQRPSTGLAMPAALRDRDPVGRSPVRLADELELAVRTA